MRKAHASKKILIVKEHAISEIKNTDNQRKKGRKNERKDNRADNKHHGLGAIEKIVTYK